MNDNYFNSRRTVRNFSDAAIDSSLLEGMIEQAMRAPPTGNMQLYSVIATTDPELKAELAKQHFNQPASVSAPMILTICADFNRFEKWCALSDAQPGFRNFQSFISALLDATIFTQQLVSIAEIAGLGTCYLGTVTYNAPQIAELLELPPMVVPVTSLAIGFPADQPQGSERLPVGGVLHQQKYHNYSEQEIMQIFRAKDEFEPNKKFIDENNKQTLAQVFTDIRYPKTNNETFSKIYYDFIKAQGFDFPE